MTDDRDPCAYWRRKAETADRELDKSRAESVHVRRGLKHCRRGLHEAHALFARCLEQMPILPDDYRLGGDLKEWMHRYPKGET